MPHFSQSVGLLWHQQNKVKSLFDWACTFNFLSDVPFGHRGIRDKLVELKYFELGRDVSLRCHINSDSVWVAWGIDLLKKVRTATFFEIPILSKRLIIDLSLYRESTTAPEQLLSAAWVRIRSLSKAELAFDLERVCQCLTSEQRREYHFNPHLP